MWFNLAWNPTWQESWGPATTRPVSVARNLDGRLEAFVIEPGGPPVHGGAPPVHGGAWHAWQAQANNGWSPWDALPHGTPISSGPFATQLGTHNLVVYSNAGGALVRTEQGPSGWGSTSTLQTDRLAPDATPFAMQDRMGLTHVFVPGADGTVRQVAQQPDGTWPQRSIASPPGVTFPSQQLGGLMSSTQMALVGRGADRMAYVALEHFSFPAQMATLGLFDSSWTAIQGPPVKTAPSGVVGLFGIGHLFAVDDNGRLLHTYRASIGNFAPWTTISSNEQLVGRPAVAVDSNGELNVFTRKASSEILWTVGALGPFIPGGGFFRHALLPMANALTDPVAIANQDGRIEVFTSDHSSRAVKHIWQNVTGVQTGPTAPLPGDFTPLEGPISPNSGTSSKGFSVQEDNTEVRIFHGGNKLFTYARHQTAPATTPSTVDVFFSNQTDRALLIDRGVGQTAQRQNAVAVSDLNSSAKWGDLDVAQEHIWGVLESPDGRLFAVHARDDSGKSFLSVWWSSQATLQPRLWLLSLDPQSGPAWQDSTTVFDVKVASSQPQTKPNQGDELQATRHQGDQPISVMITGSDGA